MEAARRDWLEANAGADLPEHFEDSLKLVIAEVRDGSAQVVLEREVADGNDTYSDFWDDARDDVARQLSALLDQTEPISEAPLFELREFRTLGSSLERGDSLQVINYSRGPNPRPTTPVAITAEQVENTLPIRAKESDRERRKQRKKLHLDQRYIAGRLVALDADRKTFKLRSLHFGDLNGVYSNDEMTADLRAVLNTSAKAPVVRLGADVQFRDGEAWRIRNVSTVELLEIDGQPWSRKFVELASLGPDWDGERPGAEMISFAALDAARDLVSRIVAAGRERPGIFPTEEGGVSLEWATALRVASIEILPDASSYELYLLPEGETSGTHSEASDINEAFAFAHEVTEA